MSLNVKSNVEVNTQNAQASIENLNKKFGAFNSTLEKFGSKYTKDAKNGIDILAHSLQATAIAFNGIKNTFNALNGFAQSFIQIADSVNLLNARLKLSTDGIKNFENASKALYSIAQNTANSVDSVSNLFITLNRSFAELGYNQEKTLEVVSTLSTALKAGGASAVDAERAITQFSQALSTGKLQEQDFKAMIGAALAAEGAMTNLQTRILERIHSRIH